MVDFPANMIIVVNSDTKENEASPVVIDQKQLLEEDEIIIA